MDEDPLEFFRTLRATNPSIPIPVLVSPAEARRQAQQRATNIVKQWKTLRAVLDRHEATIQKRWAKKSRAQRLKILLDAWPNMPSTHRPEFEAFRKETPQQRIAGTKYRQDYLWPYINKDDMSKPRTLPLLLNSRGRNLPSDFAGLDADNIRFPFVTQAVVPLFLNLHTMILNGFTEQTMDSYGTLVHWHDHEDAADWFHTQKQFQPGEGLLVLESQERLLTFLVDCCRQILHEIPQETWISSSFPVQPEPKMKEESESTGFESLAVMAAEGPYRLPAKLNLGKIESLLAAKASATEDRLWSMREDPVYFYEQLLDAKEHRHEMIKDTMGQIHHFVTDPRFQDLFWFRVSSSLLLEVFLGVEMFAELKQQAHHLHILQVKYAKKISPTDDLPEDYMKALVTFRYFLEKVAKGCLSQLKIVGPSSPNFRHMFVRQVPRDYNSNIMEVMSVPRPGQSQAVTNLKWLLSTLWEDGNDLFLAGMRLTVDELERLIEAEPEAKQFISPYVAALIGDLSIVTQCMRQLDMYHPWARTFENAAVEYNADIEKAYSEASKSWGVFMATVKDNRIQSEAVRLLEPFKKIFPYPIDRRRTKENTEALRQAESNLDAFWACVDRIMYRTAGNLSGTATGRLLLQSRILRRTPEWVEPQAKKPPAPNTSSSEFVDADQSVYKPLSALYFSTVAQTKKQKVKIKCAPTTVTVEDLTPTPPQFPSQKEKQPTFHVDARALKVFRTIFFNPDITSTPGEIPWTDFLHAMTSLGFLAQKLYGSAWQFQPTKLHVERAIQFHEPHPKGKIPFRDARRHGRRLERAYGWVGSMFVLKEGK
ncbi:hypothetical protein QBC38DRAFT_487309 [Podospora fimiseda]|uniref:Uncharacterized protein n=1 Tax=Podospora fimiseda TaxID=252190 RepID=A0AAN7BHY7_9PEZI|nr:hypothetical protein QBC38DRAFT_487309 [Podospora fimiseda]